jgi:hypothetical protein
VRRGVAACLIAVASLACVTTAAAAGTPEETTVVFALDVTESVPTTFRKQAQRAFAVAIARLAAPGSAGARVHLRKIDHDSGSDSAYLGSFYIPAVPVEDPCSGNPFGRACRSARMQTALAYQGARSAVAAITRRFRVERAGTTIRGMFAAASAIFAHSDGAKWLVVASDLRPSHAAASTAEVDLRGVHVQVVTSCSGGIAACQARESRWRTVLRHAGAARVDFLPSAQAYLILDR